MTEEAVSQALGNWRPSIDATGSIGKTSQYAPELAPFDDPRYTGTACSYGIQVKQPLFRGFRTLAETEAAEKQVLAARAKLESAEQQLLLDTAAAFLAVLREQAALKLEQAHEAVLEDKLKETKERVKLGELTGTDVRQAESRLARAHVNRLQTESVLTQDSASFTRLVGKDPEQLQAPAPTADPPKPLAKLIQTAERQNSDVISAQYLVEEARAQIRVNKGSLLPEVNLVGNSTRSYGEDISLPGREDSSQVLIQVAIPLYRSGTNYSKARSAEQTASQRFHELDEARDKAHGTAVNAWKSLATAQAALGADKQEIDAAGEALNGIRDESKVGTRTTLDVLNAEQEWLDAKIDQVKSEHDKDLAIVQIQSALGELTARNLKLPVEPYDPTRHYNDVKNQWTGFSKQDASYKVIQQQPASKR